MPEKQVNNTGGGIVAQVAERIKNSDNVLVALSKNPSVDELSAALGLTFVLDKLGKHATAIFSGAVPNAIEFLEPEKTFESNTNSLQDFIIALDKEKADHLRYKVEGDFVKVFITPYKTTLEQDDLEFSHGDYNVDLVVALNVKSEGDLDSALSEYGRIKHDASSINISADAPGKFADLEWGDPGSSSVSEMVALLARTLDDGENAGQLIEKPTATALLAGIVAATNRFSNERTTAETMTAASTLMAAGADQQLISSSIPVDILKHNDTVDISGEVELSENGEPIIPKKEEAPADPTQLTVERAPEETSAPAAAPAEPTPAPIAPAPAEAPVAPAEPAAPVVEAPIIPETPAETPVEAPEAPVEAPVPASDEVENEKVLTPPSEAEMPVRRPKDYAAEMARELGQTQAPTPPSAAPEPYPTAELPSIEAPVMPTENSDVPVNAVPVVPATTIAEAGPETTTPPVNVEPFQQPVGNPTEPPVANNAEYVEPPFPMPTDGDLLPPPPAPFVPDAPEGGLPMPSFEVAPAPVAEPTPAPEPAPAAPVSEPIMPAPVVQPEPAAPELAPAPSAEPAASPSMNGVNPVMQDQVYNDPGAFHIPGM